jgi:transposase
MQTVSTIGLDIAKSVCQIHGVDASGVVVIRRQLKRRYVLAFFEKLAPPGRHRGLCLVTLLVAPSHSTACPLHPRRSGLTG